MGVCTYAQGIHTQAAGSLETCMSLSEKHVPNLSQLHTPSDCQGKGGMGTEVVGAQGYLEDRELVAKGRSEW